MHDVEGLDLLDEGVLLDADLVGPARVHESPHVRRVLETVRRDVVARIVPEPGGRPAALTVGSLVTTGLGPMKASKVTALLAALDSKPPRSRVHDLIPPSTPSILFLIDTLISIASRGYPFLGLDAPESLPGVELVVLDAESDRPLGRLPLLAEPRGRRRRHLEHGEEQTRTRTL